MEEKNFDTYRKIIRVVHDTIDEEIRMEREKKEAMQNIHSRAYSDSCIKELTLIDIQYEIVNRILSLQMRNLFKDTSKMEDNNDS